MSIAITELGLGSPPVTIATTGSRHALLWQATCDCGYQSKRFRLLGAVLEQMRWHAEMHRCWIYEEHDRDLAA